MTTDYSFEQDLKEAEAMTGGLEDYLKADELYGSVGGGFFNFQQMPSLTVGALLMRLRRLHALRDQLNAGQQQRLDTVTDQHNSIREAWRAHYEKKMLWEANSRLDAIRPYFREVSQNQDMALGAYGPEQHRRTIVEEIHIAMEALNILSEDIEKKMREIDGQLAAIATDASGFLWSTELEPVYPQKDFWWLYRKPRQARY